MQAAAPAPQLTTPPLSQRFFNTLLEDGGWLQSTLGKDCTDARVDVGARVLAEFGRDVWPLSVRLEAQDEMWLFTGIEFYARHVAEPVASWIHEWNLCGIHVTQADRIRGALAFKPTSPV